MKLRVSCGEVLPLFAIAMYRESSCTPVSASAVEVRPPLLMFICAGTAVLG